MTLKSCGNSSREKARRKRPKRRYTRIIAELEQAALALIALHQLKLAIFGVDHHGAEFEHGEWPTTAADPSLTKDHRPAVLELDCCRDAEHERGNDHAVLET